MSRLTGRPSALIIDDSQFICKILAKSLLDYGFRMIAIAGSCEEAEAHLATFAPDLITLDLVLPDGNGFDLFNHLHTEWPEAHIVVVSNLRHQEQYEKAKSVGAHGFIGKPFEEQQLKDLILELDIGK